MNNQLIKSFQFNSKSIRVSGSVEAPLFCLSDVCKVLKLNNSSHVISQIKDEFSTPTLNVGMVKRPDGSSIEATFLTEPQLYFVMMRSRSTIARDFRQWIVNTVLPSIRKTGGYNTKNTLPDDLEFLKQHMYDKYKLVCLNSARVRDVALFEEMRTNHAVRGKLNQIIKMLQTIDPNSEYAKAVKFVIYNLDVGFDAIHKDYKKLADTRFAESYDNRKYGFSLKEDNYRQSYSLWSK